MGEAPYKQEKQWGNVKGILSLERTCIIQGRAGLWVDAGREPGMTVIDMHGRDNLCLQKVLCEQDMDSSGPGTSGCVGLEKFALPIVRGHKLWAQHLSTPQRCAHALDLAHMCIQAEAGLASEKAGSNCTPFTHFLFCRAGAPPTA